MNGGKPEGLLSVVVIGRNEGERLDRCLASVIATIPSALLAELVYVDSGSKDGSPQRAREAGARVIELVSEAPSAAMGRNAGWRTSKGEFVLFLDGDTVLRSGFVGRALEAMEIDRRLAAVWGHRREIHTERSVFNRILDLDWIYAPGFTDFCGGDALMRRAALAEVDGYDATLIAGEEPELCRRLRGHGWLVLHIDAPMTGHDLDMRHLHQYWKRSVRAGYAYAEVAQRFAGTVDPLWAAERRSNLVRGSCWFLSPLMALGVGLLFRTWIPLAFWVFLLLILALRSGWHARWKTPSVSTLFWYGIHSHLQQIPILVGQVQFTLNRRRGRMQRLIDYKNPQP